MDTHKNTLQRAYIPFYKRKMYIEVKFIFINNYLKITEICGKPRISYSPYKGFFLQPVLNKILYSNNLKIIFTCKLKQFRRSCFRIYTLHYCNSPVMSRYSGCNPKPGIY